MRGDETDGRAARGIGHRDQRSPERRGGAGAVHERFGTVDHDTVARLTCRERGNVGNTAPLWPSLTEGGSAAPSWKSAALFVQVLKLAEKAGLVKLGHVALDGTKIKANASKHKAMSYDRMKKREAELQAEVDR